jgi:D-alanyl-lipoteichoic acid acyltransferase DltB (MBOAT superfamily)
MLNVFHPAQRYVPVCTTAPGITLNQLCFCLAMCHIRERKTFARCIALYNETILNLCKKKVIKLLNLFCFDFNGMSIPELFHTRGIKGRLNTFDCASMVLFFQAPNVNHSSLNNLTQIVTSRYGHNRRNCTKMLIAINHKL